jgi:hypothetical protein
MKAVLIGGAVGLLCVAGCRKPPVPEPAKPTAQEHQHAMPQMPATVAAWADGAQLYENLGDFHRKVSTGSAEAQRYNEPADWFFPVRHLLGAQLLQAGLAPEAEAVYRADLERHPNNGWSLYGLAASLRAQKKPDAEKVDREFHKAWEKSDVVLTASAF